MAKKSRKDVTSEDLDLLDELGVETAPVASPARSAKEQRIIAGFEEIERFIEEHGRLPEHGEDRDIFERLYAVRLDRIRESAECREVLKSLDSRGLLTGEDLSFESVESEADDEELLASLGVDPEPKNEITNLVHIRPRQEITPAEEVAQRTPCQDFHLFKPLFETVQQDLESNEREAIKFKDNAEVNVGDLFILDGQKVFIAEKGELFVGEHGRQDCRLRVIYDNGTESDLLLRSLQRALNKDSASRRIKERGIGPLFSGVQEDDDQNSGSIYVLRSCSDHPFVKEHRELIHKIGVTGGNVKKRIANAAKDPTYLLAKVELVAEYKLANINRKALEALVHKFFAKARLDLELQDRFGSQVEPKEWFLVPLPVIDELIEKIKNGTVANLRYDPEKAQLTKG